MRIENSRRRLSLLLHRSRWPTFKTGCMKSALVLMTTNWRGEMQAASLTQHLNLLKAISFRVKSHLICSSRDRTHFQEPYSSSVLGNGLWKLWKLPERALSTLKRSLLKYLHRNSLKNRLSSLPCTQASLPTSSLLREVKTVKPMDLEAIMEQKRIEKEFLPCLLVRVPLGKHRPKSHV